MAMTMLLCLVLAACQGGSRSPEPGPSPSSSLPPVGPAAPVGVQLFQWSWTAIETECPRLAKDGYAFLQTSPPQESIVGEPWWVVYQPVSYRLESTLGSRAQFASMVSACKEAGVDVVVDAVINHMTGQDTAGVGTGGSTYEHYRYPGLYDPEDFHDCGLTEGNEIGGYSQQAQVQTCELLNLADLDTSKPKVRQTIAAYLTDLMSLGVVGFRVDAAKHISADDLAAIIELLPQRPKLILEVIRGGDDEPIQPEDYVAIGSSQEFGFAREVSSIFQNYGFAQLETFGTASWLPSAKAISFIDNHDTERNGETLSIASPGPYRLAEAFLLGYGYGTPVLYSGYEFNFVTDAGPPRGANSRVQPAVCGTAPWTCNHREPTNVGMIDFHRAVGDAPAETMAEGNLVGIKRGGRGFVVINAGDSAVTAPWSTGLAAGEHCNRAVPGCGEKVTVDGDGKLTGEVAGGAVVAITEDAQG